MNKSSLLLVIFFVFAINSVVCAVGGLDYYPAKVLSSFLGTHPGNTSAQLQVSRLVITDGVKKGSRVTVNHLVAAYYGKYGDRIDKVVKPGYRVLLAGDSGLENLFIYDYIRTTPYKLILGLCGLLILLIAGWRGFRAIIALSITIGLILLVGLPLILQGYPPAWLALGICFMSLLFSFLLIAGFSPKAYIAICGTTVGLLIALFISIITVKTSFVTGLVSSESSRLIYMLPDLKIDFEGLVLAGVLIGALGAVMDVGIEIASSMQEIVQHKPEISFKDLFNSGLNIGRDVLGTMINTLVLAYMGSSLIALVYFKAANIPLLVLLNDEATVVEIIRALSGSIGLMMCIPVTAFVGALVYKKRIADSYSH